jgi:hypothetical protein
VTTARTKAVQEYEKLASHGERVLNGKTGLNGKRTNQKNS